MFQSQNILFCNSFFYFFVTLILSSFFLHSIQIPFSFFSIFFLHIYSSISHSLIPSFSHSIIFSFSLIVFVIEQVDHGESSVLLSKENDKREDVKPEALKPVSEGPVKLDVKSNDRIVIRPAENGESTNLEAIDTSYTYLIVDKEYVHNQIHIIN